MYNHLEYQIMLAQNKFPRNDDVIHDKAISRALKSKYKPPKGLTSDKNKTIFIARLNPKTTESDLIIFFEKYGKITSLKLVKDVVTLESKKYAFVEYKHKNAAKLAHDKAHNEILMERKILVEYERSRNCKGWIPRRYGGGLGGNIKSGQLRFGGRDCPFMVRKFNLRNFNQI